jgi:preprotein translocase subunit SecF
MLHIMRSRAIYYLISLAIILPGLVALAIPPHLRLAVDFTGGTLWELQFPQTPQPADVKAVLADKGYPDAVVQTSGDRSVLIRSKEVPSEGSTKSDIQQALQAKFGPATELRFETVGPVIGQEIAQRAIFAVVLASIGILLYIAWAFRRVEHPVRYGLCAIIALLHDALVVLGIFSILGHLFNVEVDSLFVTAVLTVIGFSVHDTIVVFDRIRENMRRLHGMPFEDVVNHSLLQTLGRSLATSLTVLFTLSALTLFGGVTIREFSLALLIGIISGTYSSIFNASALLVSWENGDLARLFGRRRAAAPA